MAAMLSYERLDCIRKSLVELNYKQCKDFSDNALEKARIKPDVAPFSWPKFYNQYIADHNINTDPSANLDNEIHPLFSEQNWIMPPNVSAAQVYNQLLPALQLASKLVTHDRTLHWYAHVKHSQYIWREDAPPILVREASPITRDMLAGVQAQLLVLSTRMKLAWMGRTAVQGAEALSAGDISQLMAGLFDLQYLDESSPECYTQWLPTIVFNVQLLYKAIQHTHNDVTHAARRTFHFKFANILAHEMAHAWFRCCHGQCTEPLVFPHEAFPEMGFSFDNYIFGAHTPTRGFKGNELVTASSLESVMCEPRYSLLALVPEQWVNCWFLKATWQNFTELHERGEIFAPSAARQVEHCAIERFCSTRKRFFQHFIVKGSTYEQDICCNAHDCSGGEPGGKNPYPSDPEQFLQVYIDVVKADIETAERLGVGHLIPNKKPSLYAHNIRLMAGGSEKEAVVEAKPRGVRAWLKGFNVQGF